MGLFDTLSKVGAAVSEAVENAANEYKEKKAYEAAESEMRQSINDDLNEYASDCILALEPQMAEKVMAIEILSYKSFAKEGYADGVELLGAISYGADINEWAAQYKNRQELVDAFNAFYGNYYSEALKTDWYRDMMEPFYGEEAPLHLCSVLNLMMTFYLGDLAEDVCEQLYGEDDVVWKVLSERGFDFWDPLVAYFMNNMDDVDLAANLNKYEKKCFERYRDVSLFLIGRNAGMCNQNDELEHVFLKENGEPLFVGIVNDSLAYFDALHPEISKIAQLKEFSNLKIEKIKLEDIVYWKQEGECHKELGLKEPNAVVALYAASKGVVAPRRLEEKEVDTREIVLATKEGKLHFAFNSLEVFERLLPQLEYERVMLEK